MKTLIYENDPRHVLLEGGEKVHGGEEFTVSDERAAQLLADPNVPVREPEHELRKLKRAELDELAEQAGVENPRELPSKQAVIAALDNASLGSQTQPAADDGTGRTSQEA